MSDSKALVLTGEITEDKWPEIYGVGKVNDYYEQAKAEALSEVPDLSTVKGREAIASNAHKVSRSKTFVEKPGRAYLKYIKETKCAAIEKELREFVDKMDALRDEVRKPLNDWDAEQARIKAEKEAAEAEAERVRLAEIAARELQEQVDRDHELAIYLYADYLREKEAAAKAKADAEAEAKAAQERAEREKQAAIEQERQRVAAEAAAQAAEAARREKDTANKKRVNNEILADLALAGVDQATAKLVITAMAKGLVRNVKINY